MFVDLVLQDWKHLEEDYRNPGAESYVQAAAFAPIYWLLFNCAEENRFL